MIDLVRAGGKTPAQLSREFECKAQTIINWVAQAARDEGKPLPGKEGLSSAEREELARLRRQVRQLQMERDILAKACAHGKRVARLMRQARLHGVSRRRGFVVTTRRDARQRPAPDFVQARVQGRGAQQAVVRRYDVDTVGELQAGDYGCKLAGDF